MAITLDIDVLECLQKEIEKRSLSHKNRYKDRFITKDILAWGKYYLAHKFGEPFCQEMHGYLVKIRDEARTATLGPRNHAKTTLRCVLIPIYQALEEPWKYLYYLNIQNTTEKAISLNLSIRHEFETNEKIIRDYGDLTSNEFWTQKKFVLSNGIVFHCAGAGESIRGINHKNIRPDCILIDDPYDDEDINQINRIIKKNDWYKRTVLGLLAKHKNHCVHVQGTAINEADMMHEMSKVKGVKFRRFQAITSEKNKTTLWHESKTFSYKELLKTKSEMGSIIFAREYQNECRDDLTSIIKESHVQRYDEIPNDERVTITVGGCDPSIGGTDKSDFTGIAIVQITKKGNYYIKELYNRRISLEKRCMLLAELYKIHKLEFFRIEAIAAFADFSDYLTRNSGVPVVKVACVRDKISRLEVQSCKFENGKVFFKNTIPNDIFQEAKYQLINNKPNHDDIRDAIVLALEHKTYGLGVSVGYIG